MVNQGVNRICFPVLVMLVISVALFSLTSSSVHAIPFEYDDIWICGDSRVPSASFPAQNGRPAVTLEFCMDSTSRVTNGDCPGCPSPDYTDGSQEYKIRVLSGGSVAREYVLDSSAQSVGKASCSGDPYTYPEVDDSDGSGQNGVFYRIGNKLYFKMHLKTFICRGNPVDDAGVWYCSNRDWGTVQNWDFTQEIQYPGINDFFPPDPTHPCQSGGACCASSTSYRADNAVCVPDQWEYRTVSCTAGGGMPGTKTQKGKKTCSGNSPSCTEAPITWEDTSGCIASGCGDCSPGATQGCDSRPGVCEQAIKTCRSDYCWGSCVYPADYITASTEVGHCDGKDNNCNGQTDEGNTWQGIPKGGACTEGVGDCARSGTVVCTSGGGVDCSATPAAPGTETCDTAPYNDEDCDGSSNENPPCQCNQGETRLCDLSDNPECIAEGASCACYNDLETCQCGGGSCFWPGCGAPQYGSGYSTSELCDTLDNDCNGEINDGSADFYDACQVACEGDGNYYLSSTSRCCGDNFEEEPSWDTGIWGTEMCSYQDLGGGVIDYYAYSYLSPPSPSPLIPQWDEDCDRVVNEGYPCKDVCLPVTGSDPRGVLENGCYPEDFRPYRCLRDDPNPDFWRGVIVNDCTTCGCQSGYTCNPGTGACDETQGDTTPPDLTSFGVNPTIVTKDVSGYVDSILFTIGMTDDTSGVDPSTIQVQWKYYAAEPAAGSIPPGTAFDGSVHYSSPWQVAMGDTFTNTWDYQAGYTEFQSAGWYVFKVTAQDYADNWLEGESAGVIIDDEPSTQFVQVVLGGSVCTRLHTASLESSQAVYDYWILSSDFANPSADWNKFVDFTTQANTQMMAAPPFDTYQNKVNVWRLNIPSQGEGGSELTCYSVDGVGSYIKAQNRYKLPTSYYPAAYCEMSGQTTALLLSCLAQTAPPQDCSTYPDPKPNYCRNIENSDSRYADKIIAVWNSDAAYATSGWANYMDLAFPSSMTTTQAVTEFKKYLGTTMGLLPYSYYTTAPEPPGLVNTLSDVGQTCDTHPESRDPCMACDPSENTFAGCELKNHWNCVRRNDVPSPLDKWTCTGDYNVLDYPYMQYEFSTKQ